MAEWKEIVTVADWEEVVGRSHEAPLFVFKHSTQCPISAGAYQEAEAYLQNDPREDATYVLVKVIESRPVSNQVAEDLDVKHESPQAFVVKNKKEVWHASHRAITEQAIREALG
ncbi:bacillithiol system redox-active protein YtxJ [Numidum massiliense]|uniref:bacillithiol system redox-active protein YtxJ n=1 Tax=Numidum massiliense TaxID=1522315 RepID=UPI0006D564EF|nr:bacillithiol system redox-active protein YtxJ [Numidum massiliense]